MVNNSIVQGIKMAMDRGDTLQSAMISFHNAGYSKEDIEEAARICQTDTNPSKMPKQVSVPVKKEVKQPNKKPVNPEEKAIAEKEITPIQKMSIKQKESIQKINTKEKDKKEVKQKASQYGNKNPKSGTKTAIIISSILLIMLIISLIVLFLFKENIISFFNRTL